MTRRLSADRDTWRDCIDCGARHDVRPGWWTVELPELPGQPQYLCPNCSDAHELRNGTELDVMFAVVRGIRARKRNG